MRVIISGASGLIGKALSGRLQQEGARVAPLVRDDAVGEDSDGILWRPDANTIQEDALEGAHSVVHLAGENIADGRWSNAKKRRIRDSRIMGTTLLCRALARRAHKPRTLICASAIGYYGSRGDDVLDESTAPGAGFLADVCREWEQAAMPAVDAGIRVVYLRSGVVLSNKGGALGKMLPLFRMGLGGPIGNGRAWMSWITLNDLVAVILHCMNDKRLAGPVNAVSPTPVTNREFTRALAKTLRRPALMPVPALMLKVVFGEMARETFLASARVMPHRLEDAGFVWRDPNIETALQHCLK